VSKKHNSNKLDTFAKYMGMPLQLLALIGVSAYLGLLLDRHFQTSNNYFAAGFAIIALVIYLYKIVISTSK